VSEKKVATRKIMLVFFLIVVTIPIYLAILGGTALPAYSDTESQVDPNVLIVQEVAEEAQHSKRPIGAGATLPPNLLDPTIALANDVKGVVILALDNDTVTPISTIPGVEKTVVFTAKFVSYDESVSEAILLLNPQDPYGQWVGKGLGDGKGTVIYLNDVIKYNARSIVIPSNKIVKIIMTINIPDGTPDTSIPLAPVGIDSNYPIINKIRGDVDVIN
jgi:hypothetical protein